MVELQGLQVSSQSWKKAIRDYFNEFGCKKLEQRTRVPKYISEEIKLDQANRRW